MIKALSKIFRSDKAVKPLPSVPEGERYYVIGDIHGRCDLFEALVQAIEHDEKDCEGTSTIILLGDLVDRGPDSAGVIAIARALENQRPMRFLAGNHEEMFLESFEDRKVLRHFVKHGGRETIMSYGLTRKQYDALELAELQDEMRRLVPQEHRDFLAGFEDMGTSPARICAGYASASSTMSARSAMWWCTATQFSKTCRTRGTASGSIRAPSAPAS